MTGTLSGLAVAAACAAVQATVSAQESVGVTRIAQREVTTTSPWLSILRTMVARNDARMLSATAGEFLTELGNIYKRGAASDRNHKTDADQAFYAALKARSFVCCDYKMNYYMLLFTAVDAQGKSTLVHLLVHEPEPRNSTLPGLEGAATPLYEVFLAEDTSVAIQGSYDIERVENPATRQLADFVTTLIGKVALPVAANIAGKTTTIPALDGGKKAFKQSVTIGEVRFTHARARLTGHHAAIIAQPIVHLRAVTAAVANEVRFLPGTISLEETFDSFPAALPNEPAVCGSLLTSAEKALTDDLAGADACKYSIGEPTDCLKKLKITLSDVLKKFTPTTQCDMDDARATVTAFQPVIQADLSRVTGTTLLNNQPLQRYSFGLATGFIGGIQTASAPPRAEIQNNKIAANPFSRAIALGIVNLPLWGYDPGIFEPTVRERLRPFVGFAFTPYFGVSAGGGWAFSRYVSVNVGYARLWYDTPKDDEQFDQPAKNKTDPFRLGATNAWFIAAGYSLGGR